FFTQKMGLTTFNPDLLHLKRIKKAIPQYTIQSKERLMSIATMEAQCQGLHLAGNIRDGIGMADRIKQGADLAKEIIERP
ncbi:MAG: protoporphyrinogen oxidase, partial [Bacteroidia bacterium]